MSSSLWKRRGAANDGIGRLREEMDRTFERFMSEPFGLGLISRKDLRAEGWFPAIDVSESESELTVRAEVPGIPAKELEITVTDHTLTISGEKEERDEKKGEDFYQCERRFGSFRRVIDLPEGIDPNKVTAESDDGVVTIHVAKKPGVQARQIEVKPTQKRVPVGV